MSRHVSHLWLLQCKVRTPRIFNWEQPSGKAGGRNHRRFVLYQRLCLWESNRDEDHGYPTLFPRTRQGRQ